jgi:hypothetical protein
VLDALVQPERPRTRWVRVDPQGPPEDEFVFGERLTAARSGDLAGWLSEAVVGSFGSVGGLLPAHYESYLLVESAPESIEDWWRAQRQIITALAEVLSRFTDTPEESWFAIWEGHSSYWDSVEALRRLPRLDRPHRSYYLISGRVIDVENIVEPMQPRGWFRPDLWWPEDRRWFVGTDVDFWCNYIGGSRAMTDAVTSRLPGLCEPVTLDAPLRVED